MPLIRFERCWPLPTESLPELPQNVNIVTLALTLTLWPINSGYWFSYSSHTSHYPSQTLCHPLISYATQKLMLDSCKMVEKQSEAFHTFLWHHSFPSLKQNFIAYHSSKVSDGIFEIRQLWQSGFGRVYSNFCCSCSSKSEIITIAQSSHKMYSNNILNFQEATTILNDHTKDVWKLIVCTSYMVYIYVLLF